VQIDALAVRLRPRTPLEAADLGVRLCQASARSVFSSYAAVAVPLMVLAIASWQIAGWLPSVLIWWLKPWLDRTILFSLSRAAFGQRTRPSDVWRDQRHVLWGQLLFMLTVQRVSLWRSLTQPVYQLEGASLWRARDRVRQIRRRYTGSAMMLTSAFSVAETALSFGMLALLFWLAPMGRTPDIGALLSGDVPGILSLTMPVVYAMTVLFLEPFFVAAGFAMYLNRRAELEAWDIEQEFRRAFAS
jgi:hypothetical protein